MTHEHAEAFNLMQYESEDGRERLIVWNSRDGVTPFGMSHPVTKTELRHVRWNEDVHAPDYKPAVGEYIWIDLHPEKALQKIVERVERWWDDGDFPMRQFFSSKRAAAEAMLHEMFNHEHPTTGETFKVRPPDLVCVDAAMIEARGWAQTMSRRVVRDRPQA